jgi:hypothetical protein
MDSSRAMVGTLDSTALLTMKLTIIFSLLKWIVKKIFSLGKTHLNNRLYLPAVYEDLLM